MHDQTLDLASVKNNQARSYGRLSANALETKRLNGGAVSTASLTYTWGISCPGFLYNAWDMDWAGLLRGVDKWLALPSKTSLKQQS